MTDRDVLRSLLLALDAPKCSLRRDECGSWRVTGRKGHIYTWGPSGGWLLFCDGHSPRKWSAIKRRLSFCKVTQDGDTEGCLRLFALPTPEQAAEIRKALGVRRKRAANAGSFAGSNLASANRGVSGAPACEKGKDGAVAHPAAPRQKSRQNPPVNEPEVAQSRFRSRGR
ncbi:MAG TPA: hypothetical protein VHK03_10410 [Aestuariivirgaceae bacterium]|nr:hypothetical protein [Aestuariivirgaceae bacterium]